jgi:crotonobetainyl-CoA:carnitine CoA-transferase CaiB-like acyl-CoA transferase
MLEHLRVLDLTDERGLLCGRLLADMGADVVQVEPLGGSTARRMPPVVGPGDAPSMYWETFAAGKRGVAFDFDHQGQIETLRRLAAGADILITSARRPWLAARGLDPESLHAVNDRLVYVVISAFGWDGPKADYADTDLVVWAAGGPLDPHREGDRPPLRISVPQAYLHASADAAAGALIAVRARRRFGRGQVVDVSAQASLGVATLGRVLADAVGDGDPAWHKTPAGNGDRSGSGAATPNRLKKWACRDGLVELHLSMGPAAGSFTNRLFGWMHENGAVGDDIASWDWREMPDLLAREELTAADIERARESVAAFLRPKTKLEVLEAAIRHRLLCMGIFDAGDVAASPQLAARGFWADLDVDGRSIRVPGRFAHVTGHEVPRVRRRAPRVGEHQDEVLAQWPTAGPKAGGRGRRTAALAGLRVLDLSWVVAGPLISRALADFGAEVVRVESSRRIETARLMPPFHDGKPGVENSALFGNCNAGKLGVTVDLAGERGRKVVLDLIDRADVVVESFSPGKLAAWGLDYRSLAARKPDLIMVSTSIAGQDGPWSGLAGFGNVGASISGFQSLVGWEDDLPVGPFGPYTDYVAPRLALVALLAALEDRDKAGRGCYIDVAQVEAGVFFLSPQIAHVGWDGTVAARCGNDDPLLAPHGVYPCADERGVSRFVAVAVRDERDWLRLCEVIGRPDLRDRAELRGAEGRRAHRVEIDGAVASWTAARPAHDVERSLQGAGVPAHRSASSADVVADPQLAAREHFVRLPHPLHGKTVVEAPRYRLSATPGAVRRAAPTLGQDNERVLVGLLGYTRAEFEDLERAGVLR